MRAWMLRGGVILLGVIVLGTLLWVVFGALVGHNPNHGINREEARKAAHRVLPPPPPDTRRIPGYGG